MAERSYQYHVADVFTAQRLTGNPLAVFPAAHGLTTSDMQAIARETNLSETTFVFAPERGGLARVRIFTPDRELPFAGHPTIGTAFVLVALGAIAPGIERFDFEEGIGDVEVRIERGAEPFFAWLRTPPIAFGAALDRNACAAMLGLHESDLLAGIPPHVAGAGNPFLYVALRDPATVDRATLDPRALAVLAPNGLATGVFFFAPAPDTEATFYSRMLAPEAGVAEDPATGSATGPLGAYLARYGLLPLRDGTRFTNEQGVRMRRRSLIHGVLRVAPDGTLTTVDIGGNAVLTTRDATMFVP